MAARKPYTIKVFDHEIEEIKNIAKASHEGIADM